MVRTLLLRFILTPFNTGNYIGNEGVIKLSEALKSNSSLKKLNLTGNGLLASVHSHSVQIIPLEKKEQSNYLKHSDQIRLSLRSISVVTGVASFHPHSIQGIGLVF
jgi:hypothetical protein